MSYWSDKTVLITGAGGFIGSHLTERLVELGADTRCFVRYNSRNDWGYIEFLKDKVKNELTVIPGDLKDPDGVKKGIEGSDVVFHLGSLIAIPYSYVNPRETIETNIKGTLNVLQASKDVEKVVHTSTSEVYGTAKYVPIDENHPLQAQSPYSASKIGADKIAESFYLSYDLPVTIIRPFNTYGPRQSARAITPTIITQALTSNEVYLGSTHPTRDLTFVSDVVEGFLKIAESKKSTGEVINIGSNHEISVGELANKIASLLDKEIVIKSDKARVRPQKSEVARLLCNNSKARKILGWKPTVSFEEGLRRTIEWMSKNIQFYKPEIYNV
jgi:NAD dependent epimerase/dehydratase